MDLKALKKLIAAGESQTLEFKESFGDEALETIAAFANTNGGVLLIGVTDKGGIKGFQPGKETLRVWANKISQSTGLNPAITRVQADSNPVIAITVSESPVKPVACAGRYLKRVDSSNRRMTDDDITRLVLEKVGITWDEIIETRAKPADIDAEKLSVFRALCNEKRRRMIPARDSDKTVLEKLGLLKNGKLLRAAMLLFAKEPQRWYPSASLKIGRFRPGGIIVDDKEVGGTIFEQIDGAMDYFREHLQTRFEFKGTPSRDVIWEYPLEALREAVTNAVCHRDYLDVSQTQIRWYDDQILIVNPGSLIPPLTPQSLLKAHVSKQRNRKIAEMLYYAGLIEKWGSGTLEIARSCGKAGLPAPKFKEDQGALWITFPHKTEPEKKVLEKVPEKVTANQGKILSEAARNPRITNKELADVLGISERKVRDNLSKLKVKGHVRRIGPDKGGHWEVLPGPARPHNPRARNSGRHSGESRNP